MTEDEVVVEGVEVEKKEIVEEKVEVEQKRGRGRPKKDASASASVSASVPAKRVSKPRASLSLREVEANAEDGGDLVGTRIKKEFGNQYYFGKVTAWKAPYYKVVYEDGDKEELTTEDVTKFATEEEAPPAQKSAKSPKVAKARAARKSSTSQKKPAVKAARGKPAAKVAAAKKVAKKKATASKQGKEGVEAEEVGDDVPGKPKSDKLINDLIGRKMAKMFDSRIFHGIVDSFDAPFYKVKYVADNDEEEMTRRELLQYIV